MGFEDSNSNTKPRPILMKMVSNKPPAKEPMYAKVSAPYLYN